MIVVETQRFMPERMKATVRSPPVDHAPVITAPGPVVEIILEAVAAAGAAWERCETRPHWHLSWPTARPDCLPRSVKASEPTSPR